ncbi:cupredoxin domain-containing protein [Simplicispira lacusdiani]|uniref:cupredoxin domain-containing protein n=1 Tax=Simplicispira lacusdiani TaxID=2213010 RepID=UPI0018E5103C|nr:cupredoxin domain-containing protein [Simplicispira lacusdiani]
MLFSVMKAGWRVLPCAALAFSVAATSLPVSAQQTVEVAIQNYRFEPAEVRVRVGDTVRWTNQEKRTSHSVLFSPEQGGESERFFPQESWQRRFDAPGQYPYSCGPHPEMKGVVVVVAP